MVDICLEKNNILHGSLPARPSKSILHRRIIAAALTKGQTLLPTHGFPLNRDNALTLDAISVMRIAHVIRKEEQIEIIGELPLTAVAPDVECGASGSTLRFLLPLALLRCHGVRFHGEPRLFARPLQPYLEQLIAHGAIVKRNDTDLLVGGLLFPGEYTLPGNISSQFASGLLLCLPQLNAPSSLIFSNEIQSRPYIELTRAVLRSAGVETVWRDERCLEIAGGQTYSIIKDDVEGDYSNAAVFLSGAAMSGQVIMNGLPEQTVQGDAAIMDILREYGASVDRRGDSVQVVAGDRRPFECDMGNTPDLLPVLAVLACASNGVSRMYNAERLRYKESDRLSAITYELNRLGANIEIEADGLVIHGHGSLHGGAVNAQGDHRIAMALALASCIADGEITLRGAEQVYKSAPEFWQQFHALGAHFEVKE